MSATTDRGRIKEQQQGMYASTAGMTDAKAAVNQTHEETFVLATFAAADYAEMGIAFTKACKVKAIRVLPAATLAVHGSNYVTGTFAKRDGAGGAAATIGTYTTNSSGGAALTAFTPTTVTPDVANSTFAAGNVLTFKQVDAGTTTEVLLTVSVTVEYI